MAITKEHLFPSIFETFGVGYAESTVENLEQMLLHRS